MKIKYYPNKRRVNTAVKHDDPLLMLVSFNGELSIVGHIDDSAEHYILLKKAGLKESDIDKYFRIIVNKSGASWTFVCPSSYLNLSDRNRRFTKYYENGIVEISKALKVIGYDVPIDIPARYRRHFNELRDNGNNILR
jgi:hypothetical protein